MPRSASIANGRILHPTYRWAYLKIRNGSYHAVVHDVARSTGIRADGSARAKQDALKVLDQRLREYLNQDTTAPRSTPSAVELSVAAEEFLTFKAQHIAPRSLRMYYSLFVTYFNGSEFILTDTDAIRRHIILRTSELGYGEATTNGYMKKLQAFFRYCIDAGYCSRSPIVKDMIPRVKIAAPQIFTWDELDAVYNYLRTGSNYLRWKLEREENIRFMQFLSLSAVRPSEAIKLKLSDVTSTTIRIDGKRSRYDKPKIRYIVFDLIPQLQDIVTAQISVRNGKDKLWSWQNNYHKPSSNFRDALTALGILNGRSIYDLRKTALNYWEKTLLLPKDVRNIMAGHSDAVHGHYYQEPSSAESEKIIRHLAQLSSVKRPE